MRTNQLLVAVALLVTWSGTARADKRDFAWSYGWYTPGRGEREVESFLTWNSPQNAYEWQLEYETGITRRWATSLYLVFAGDDHQALKWQAFNWENRVRWGRFAPNRLMHAGYLELEQEDATPLNVEGKWLLSLYTPRQDALALNLIAEHKLSAHAHPEFSFTAGWTRRLGRAGAGLEATGEFNDSSYHLGPTVYYDVTDQARVVANVMPGLTTQSDAVVGRLAFEYEW